VAGGAWTESIIHNFAGATAEGFYTYRGFDDQAMDACMYGSTTSGGPAPTCATAPDQFYCGIVFELKPPSEPGGNWTEIILHDFTGQFGNGDGSDPHGTLVQNNDGVLFGASGGGGAYGNGTAFLLKP
jgi:hypothetical protein